MSVKRFNLPYNRTNSAELAGKTGQLIEVNAKSSGLLEAVLFHALNDIHRALHRLLYMRISGYSLLFSDRRNTKVV
jgi:hypothetical protein